MNKTKTRAYDLADTVKIVLENWERTSLMEGAAAMTYYLLLSLVPILLVFANVIPFLPFSSQQAIRFVQNTFPVDISRVLIPIVREYLESGSGGAISIGLLASIWSASKVFSTMRTILDRVYGATEEKNFIIARLLSLLIMLVILMLVGVSIFAFVFGEQILSFVRDFFDIKIVFFETFLVLRWMLFPVVLMIVALVIYHLVPNHHLKIKYAMPGTVFVTVSLIFLSESFSLLTKYMGGDAITNQTLGGFIVLMLFLFVGNLLLLFGALLNTLFFEIKNNESVTAYETRLRNVEKMEASNWGGYPNEAKEVLLKRKLYKTTTSYYNNAERK